MAARLSLRARNNLAVSLGATGDTGQARELLTETLAWCLRLLGDHHPLTIQVRASLGYRTESRLTLPGR